MTVGELVEGYQRWAADYYRCPKTGRVTGTVKNVRFALREIFAVIEPNTAAEAMTPKLLHQVRESMVASGRLCRKVVNERVAWIVRMYQWAAAPERELVADAVALRLGLLKPLPYARSKARETEPVESVPLSRVEATCLYASEKLRTMIMAQWFTGCRPDEICKMRLSWIDRSQSLWLYEPAEHKMAYRKQRRIIPIGPKARAALERWLPNARGDVLFEGTTGRIHPTGKPMRESSYYAAIEKINKKHRLPRWSPNRIRHSYATRVEQEAGVESAQLMLDHADVRTTRIYCDPNLPKKRALAMRFG